jgi:tetratricopeptide (TPR) repeat protein
LSPWLKRLLAGFFLLLASHGTVIAAEPATPEEKAAAHLEAGNQRLEAGEFAAAIAEYQAGYAIYPRASLLFNIGLAQTELGQLVEAVESFEAVLTRPETTPEVAADAREHISQLHEKLAIVAVKGGNGAALGIDAQPPRELPLPKPLLLLPGSHALRATREGYLPFERQLSAEAGSHTDVEIVLAPVPPPPRPKHRYWLWATVGAAVAAGAVVTFLVLRKDDCPPGKDQCIALTAH